MEMSNRLQIPYVTATQHLTRPIQYSHPYYLVILQFDSDTV